MPRTVESNRGLLIDRQVISGIDGLVSSRESGLRTRGVDGGVGGGPRDEEDSLDNGGPLDDGAQERVARTVLGDNGVAFVRLLELEGDADRVGQMEMGV